MSEQKKSDSGTIRVADITLAHLSRGVYRSTAAAFKELVSNAYDADAPLVRIDTNFPEFDLVSCVDDGSGMPLEEFLRYFAKEGIGSCIKRKDERQRTEKYGRQIIGRLGIGMLAIGQLCHSFSIESHYEDDTGQRGAYRASIILEDDSVPDVEDALRNADSERKSVPVGNWEYETIPYNPRRKGFRLYSSDVRDTFRNEMKSSVNAKERERMSFKLSDLHSTFYSKATKPGKSVRDLAPYLEAIWELAILCPVRYYGDKDEYPVLLSAFGPGDRGTTDYHRAVEIIAARQQQFIGDQFTVVFDGIELARHVQLPTEPGLVPRLYPVEFDDVVYASPLKFEGYFFAQVPRAVRPPELNGVQIRLRGVGIGGYDSTFLNYYEKVETIRSRWVSGEVFVDQGLEEALNIDRDSFNEHDEHFKKLRSVLHEELRGIFAEARTKAHHLSAERAETREEKLWGWMRRVVKERSSGSFELVERGLDDAAPLVAVEPVKGQIVLNSSARRLSKRKATTIMQAVDVAYHLAMRTGADEEDRHTIFQELLKQILSRVL